MKNSLRVGILGAGHIAEKMAKTIVAMPDVTILAVASRSMERAHDFAARYAIERAYDSYETLVTDPDVDLVYVATPHSHHYQHARLALEHDKPVLVEKAFTANAREAAELIRLAHERGVFMTEAIWTRYMPMSQVIGEKMESGVIGEARLLTATLCYMMEHKERILRPELCGGALLDLGVYVLNFARMYFGSDIVRTVSSAQLWPTGVDMQECISLCYADGRMANLQAGALTFNDKQGIISGTEGYIRVDNINCPRLIEIYRNDVCVERIVAPEDMISGYEYQLRECKRCLENGLIESPMMPHSETLAIMQQMDALRAEWGVRYPMDFFSKNHEK